MSKHIMKALIMVLGKPLIPFLYLRTRFWGGFPLYLIFDRCIINPEQKVQ